MPTVPASAPPAAEPRWMQAELQNHSYRPLHLQPLGGTVYIGGKQTTMAGPDTDEVGQQYQRRFHVHQNVNAAADYPAGNKHQVMALFEMNSSVPSEKEVSAAHFVCRQVGGGAWSRAVEARSVRTLDAQNNRTWALELGVHNKYRGGLPWSSVGI